VLEAVILLVPYFKLKFVCVNCAAIINIIEQFDKWLSLHITTSHIGYPDNTTQIMDSGQIEDLLQQFDKWLSLHITTSHNLFIFGYLSASVP
jgi:hypothetical protein